MRRPITRQETEVLQPKNATVKFIDIRSAPEYEKQHIPVAINIPAEELNSHLSSFRKDDIIICVCNHGKSALNKRPKCFMHQALKIHSILLVAQQPGLLNKDVAYKSATQVKFNSSTKDRLKKNITHVL